MIFQFLLCQVAPKMASLLLRAASPYATAPQTLKTAAWGDRDSERWDRDPLHLSPADVWITATDAADVLMLAGCEDVDVVGATTALEPFLPGIPSGKLCFQVTEKALPRYAHNQYTHFSLCCLSVY